MTYEYKMHLFIKTTGGEQFLDSQILAIVSNALWACPQFRDIFICEFENQLTENNDGWTSAPSSVVQSWKGAGVNPISLDQDLT